MHVVPGGVMMRLSWRGACGTKGKEGARRAGFLRHGGRQPCAAQEAPGRQKRSQQPGSAAVGAAEAECTLCGVSSWLRSFAGTSSKAAHVSLFLLSSRRALSPRCCPSSGRSGIDGCGYAAGRSRPRRLSSCAMALALMPR